ncbi:MAG: kelch repeat-containing protein [Flavobacteriales bacterium]
MNARSLWTIATVLGALPLATNVQAQQFLWEEKTSMPVGRWGASTFVIDGLAYVVAGRLGNVDRTEMWCYDPDLDTWTTKADIPVGRRLAAAFSINGKGYVACGLTGTSTKLSDLWEYDPVTDSWTEKAAFPGQARYGTFHFALNGKGYVGTGNVGSSAGPFLTDSWSYEPLTDSWSQSATIPDLARHGTSSFIMNGKGYVVGGKESDQFYSNDLWEFDPITQTWSSLAPFPGGPRSSQMAFTFGSIAVVGCGRDESENFFDVWVYNRITDQWTISLQYPGESSLAGTSFTIGQRSFGGLGWLLTDNSSRADLWELVKPDDVGIQDRKGNSSFSIYPNPAGACEVVRISDESGRPTIVNMLTLDGSIVGSWRVPSGGVIPFGQVRPGTYLIQRASGVHEPCLPLIIVDRARPE